MQCYIVNKEEIGDFPYRFKSGDRYIIVHAPDIETAREIYEDFQENG